jgi:hypothetical protein
VPTGKVLMEYRHTVSFMYFLWPILSNSSRAGVAVRDLMTPKPKIFLSENSEFSVKKKNLYLKCLPTPALNLYCLARKKMRKPINLVYLNMPFGKTTYLVTQEKSV